MKIVLVTGGFDPLHSGHIEYFKAAKQLGDELHVGLNSDEWLTRKKGRPFMSFEDRASIINELSVVDKVISFDDKDNSACGAIYKTLATHSNVKLVFANGGDRTNTTTPEYETYGETSHVDFVFGVGGENKMNSSSWILDEWKTQKTVRDWGYWRDLDDKTTVKVKELVINAGKSLSNQRHKKRSEFWYVIDGQCNIDIVRDHIIETNVGRDVSVILNINQQCVINPWDWHRAYNVKDKPCHVIEIQYGEECIEEDIERR